jgi:hypothetical protein
MNDEARISPTSSFMVAQASAVCGKFFPVCVHLRNLRPISVRLSRELFEGRLDNRSREVFAERGGECANDVVVRYDHR